MIRRISQPLSMAEQNEVLENKLRWLLDACEGEASLPLRILVFGSAARGELREDSDVDIALVFADEQTMGKARKAVARSPRHAQRAGPAVVRRDRGVERTTGRLSPPPHMTILTPKP